MDDQKGSKTTQTVDRFGAFASTACAIHCAVCVLSVGGFATIGLDFLDEHEAEWMLTVLAVVFGVLGLLLGWRQHKQPLVAALLGIGIAGLIAVRLMEGGDHHEEGEEAEAVAEVAEETDEEEGHDDHEEGHDDHGPGESLGIVAGLILMAGHVGNLKAMRETEGASQEDDCC